MNQDTTKQWMHTHGSAESYSFFRVPYRCTVTDFQACAGADIGDAQTLTLTELGGGETLGVYTFGSGIAAGATGSWAADSTNGGHVLEEGEVIKVTGTAGAAGPVACDITLDPYAR